MIFKGNQSERRKKREPNIFLKADQLCKQQNCKFKITHNKNIGDALILKKFGLLYKITK